MPANLFQAHNELTELMNRRKAEEKAKAEKEAKAKVEANSVKLKVLIAFTDKYTQAEYAINDEIVVDKDRAKELLANSKRLVEKLD